ncbi:PEP-CTERM sorting domain-containing protein [Psychromonas hadalis]|uniref:PEP-CTERM sorting domain-containing protein n=1 Tax=Psychromonas hadalis TaxID=211669 RepID=UPI0003B74E36|nr:PEP-CTERM sorting domain-containing protein [Psychromonas hadalis]
MNKLTTMAAAITLASVFSANALPILEIDTTGATQGALSDFISGNYNPLPIGSGPSADINGWWGANILFTGNGADTFDLTWTLVGSESGFDNVAFADKFPNSLGDGGNFATNPLDGPNLLFVDNDGSSYNSGDTVTRTYSNEDAGEAFGFEFVANCVEGVVNGCVGKTSAENGMNSRNDALNFFISDMQIDVNGLSFAYLFFNDGGAGGDIDFDDMVLKVSETGPGTFSASIPEPASFALLGLALLGFGVARRKQRV